MTDTLTLQSQSRPPAAQAKSTSRSWIGWLAAAAALSFLPTVATNDYQMHLANVICLNIILAVGLNIVKGFSGQVTVGHIGLYAVGAYASALLSINFGFPFWLALPAAIAITAFAGLVIGIPAIRLEGAYLALATLGFAESVRIILISTDYFGTSLGISGIPSPVFGPFVLDTPGKYFYLLLPVTLLSIAASFALLRSGVGRAFMAVREDRLAAAAAGIDVRRYKLLAFLISAIYAGCAGSLYAHMMPGYINPNNFTITEMVLLLTMVVVGGIGRIWGGIIGAILVTIVHDELREYYQYEYIILGLIIVLMVTYMPKGIEGLFHRIVSVRRFRRKREARRHAA